MEFGTADQPRAAASLVAATLAALAAAVAATPARAAGNLVVNGDFEQFSNPSATPTASYQLNSPHTSTGGSLSGWTNAGYSFIFNAGTADTTGAHSSEYNNTLKLWGPNSGSANGLVAASPTGGNFLANDGAYEQGALTQTISGLTVGYTYLLSFWWAAAQQTGYTGATTEAWGVTFGSQTYNTETVSNPSQGFTPWRQAVFSFVPTSASQTLSFLAAGAPSGTPPFSLLDGIVLMAPEPSSLTVVAVGLLGAAWLGRSRRRPAPAPAPVA